MNDLNSVLASLKKNELQNINIICFIENNTISDAEMIGESVIIRGSSDREWVYISCSDEDDLRRIRSGLSEKDENFGAIESWIVPILLRDKELCWKLECEQYYLPDDVRMPKLAHETTALSTGDTETIYENSLYKEYISKDYIADRIERGISAGIFENNRLVAWGMTQDDGGMGFLHVLDDYRRRGYGFTVVVSLIEQIRKRGKIPFTYIEEENIKSGNLIKKLGFIPQKKIQWFQMK
jgi:8-oxo-dGTP diphosphatase